MTISTSQDPSPNSRQTLQLSDNLRDRLQQDAEKLSTLTPDSVSNSTLLRSARSLAKKYALLLQPFLAQLTQPRGAAFVRIENLPYDKYLPPAPTDGKRPVAKETFVTEQILLTIIAAANLEPLSYWEEKNDALIHEIAPSLGQEDTLSNGGRIPLGFHSDHAILKDSFRPQFLLLMGLKNPQQTPTYIAEIDRALQDLSSRHQRLLQDSLYRVEMPDSFHWCEGKVLQSAWQPLVTRNEYGEWEIAANTYAVKSKNKSAQNALNSLIDVLPHVTEKVVLNPGDLICFSNSKCLHARSAITGERWLQRCLARTSLNAIRRATNSNENDYIFNIRDLVLL